MLILALCSALSAPSVAQPPVPDGPVYLAQADVAVAAPAETPTEADVPGLVTLLAQAVRDKDWALVVAFSIMLLVAGWNWFLIKVNIFGEAKRKIILPWSACATACLVMFAGKLIAGGDWGAAAMYGFFTGAAAIGVWEVVIQKGLVPLIAWISTKFSKAETPKP